MRELSLDIVTAPMFSGLVKVPVKKMGFVCPHALFDDDEESLNDFVTVFGNRYKIIGILKKQGAFEGGSSDRRIIIPIQNARGAAGGRVLRYTLDVGIDNPLEMEYAMSEARGLMRSIRRDPIGEDDSFELRRSQTLAEELDEISGYLKAGGFGIGFITLLGASIGLPSDIKSRTKRA